MSTFYKDLQYITTRVYLILGAGLLGGGSALTVYSGHKAKECPPQLLDHPFIATNRDVRTYGQDYIQFCSVNAPKAAMGELGWPIRIVVNFKYWAREIVGNTDRPVPTSSPPPPVTQTVERFDKAPTP